MKRILATLIGIMFLCFSCDAGLAASNPKLVGKTENSQIYLYEDTLVIDEGKAGKPARPYAYAEMWFYEEYNQPYPDGIVSRKIHIQIRPDKREICTLAQDWQYADEQAKKEHALVLAKQYAREYVAKSDYEKYLSQFDHSGQNAFSGYVEYRDVTPGSLDELFYDAVNKAYKREKSWFKIF